MIVPLIVELRILGFVPAVAVSAEALIKYSVSPDAGIIDAIVPAPFREPEAVLTLPSSFSF